MSRMSIYDSVSVKAQEEEDGVNAFRRTFFSSTPPNSPVCSPKETCSSCSSLGCASLNTLALRLFPDVSGGRCAVAARGLVEIFSSEKSMPG